MSAVEELNVLERFNFEDLLMNIPSLPAEAEEKMLQCLLLKLQLTLPALKDSNKSLTTVDIIEHAISYIRQLWKMLEENEDTNEATIKNSLLPSNKCTISFLAS